MDISSLNSVNSNYNKNTNSSNIGSNLGKDDFLKILSAQLQYQDPMSSGDNTEFIAQMAQFSALEQMQNLNNSFMGMMQTLNVQFGSELVGKNVTIEVEGDNIEGIVEKVKLNSDGIQISVDGKDYFMNDIIEISNE